MNRVRGLRGQFLLTVSRPHAGGGAEFTDIVDGLSVVTACAVGFLFRHFVERFQLLTATAYALSVGIASGFYYSHAHVQKTVVGAVLTNDQRRGFRCRSVGVMNLSVWRERFSERLFRAYSVCVDAIARLVALEHGAVIRTTPTTKACRLSVLRSWLARKFSPAMFAITSNQHSGNYTAA